MNIKTRVQFDFTVEQLAMLDKLKGKMGASSRAEVVRRSLKLLGTALDGDIWVRGKDAVLRSGEDAILRKLEIV
jgi:hypothetical protein